MNFQADKISDLKQYLSNEFAMETDEIDEMLEIFFESMSDLITAAESQIAAADTEQLAATGHAIKGSSANINAVGISSLGLALENAGKEKNLASCQETVEAFKKAIAHLKSEY